MSKSFVTTTAPEIRVTCHWIARMLCLLSILSFMWFTGLAWYFGQPTFAFIFLIFVILSLYGLITTFTTTYADATGITVTTATAAYTLTWDEMITVETNPTPRSAVGNTMVFRGGTKAIVVNLTFTDKEGNQMRRFLAQKIAQRGIVVRPLNSVSPKNVNTKRQ